MKGSARAVDPPSHSGRWALLAGMALLVLAFTACAHGHTAQAKKVSPVVLALLALAPADLGGAYAIASDQYVDDDGQPVAQPTREFERRLTVKAQQANGAAAPPATNLLITLGQKSIDEAAEFVTAASDEDVGPADVQQDLQTEVPDARDVRTALLQDFDVLGDDSAAFQISWTQGDGDAARTWHSYRVYVRSGGYLMLVALRAPSAPGGAEPEGLRKQAETLAKKQADKLQAGSTPLLAPAH
ncbi:MAG TPA: hypothetical protein VKV26_08160 [Dehalococcoidia bacterium]|nr:hypothetical protein [Dehalococcoidia bacterium]